MTAPDVTADLVAAVQAASDYFHGKGPDFPFQVREKLDAALALAKGEKP